MNSKTGCFLRLGHTKGRLREKNPSPARNEVNPPKMNKTVKTIWNAATWVLVLILIVVAVLLAGVRLVGLRPLTVLSGSMEPVYSAGDLIYVKEVDYRDLKEGDIITFMLSEDTIATHRIVGIVPDENEPGIVRYRTKGDANDAEDGSLVHCKNVVGKPVWSLPKMGFVANYIQNPPGSYISISVGAVLMLLVFLPDLFDGDESREEKPAGEEAPKADKPKKKKRRKGGKYLRK